MLENRADDPTEPRRDTRTTHDDGTPIHELPVGTELRDIVTPTDDRGTVFELLDDRTRLAGAPIVFSYCFTIRPGVIKGWGLHERHEDRYALMFGELEVVLYDEREDSPTRGLVSKVVLSEHRRQALVIPRGVWHADRNIGARDAVVVNFPTISYDRDAPDKLRLPLDSPRIPYSFGEAARGW
jgi:dTDP-4-dehydrorhamnose 3,5-epimerase